MMQVLTGVWFGSNIVYFMQRNGVSEEISFNIGLGQSGLALVGTALAWWIMSILGRRTLYLTGQSVMLATLLIVGFLGIPDSRAILNWVSAVLLCIFFFAYQLTIGPTCYCIVTEMPSLRLRLKTVVLARVAYILTSFGANWLNPPILNPLAWNLRGKGAFIWAGFNCVMLVWSFFRLPEPRGLSSAEIDLLFEARVPARKFQSVALQSLVRESKIDGTNLPTTSGEK
jgi:SP family general alpha glucoside:H+ symporter-like MFS transporter